MNPFHEHAARIQQNRDTQRTILLTIGAIAFVYFLFSYLLPYVQHLIRKEIEKRNLLKKLEEETTLNSVGDLPASTNIDNDKNGDLPTDQSRAKQLKEAQQPLLPNYTLSASKFIPKAEPPPKASVKVAATRVESSTASLTTSSASVPPPSRPSQRRDTWIPPTSTFSPQFSNLPAAATLSPLQQRLHESRKKLIEEQNREYEQSLAKEREEQRKIEERQAKRQAVRDSVQPEPDETCKKEEVLVFAFRAKQLSLKADELNKPFKSTRRFLKSNTWQDVVQYVRSLELRPMDAAFTITANATNSNFQLSFPSTSTVDTPLIGDVSNGSLYATPLGDSDIPSNTVLWIHYN